jgi:DNA-binding Lrp family transcriptional regulator
MVVAYALVEADTTETDRLLAAVTDIDAVRSAHVVAGDVDLIANVEVADPTAVSEVVAKGIGGLDEVRSTETYMTMDG